MIITKLTHRNTKRKEEHLKKHRKEQEVMMSTNIKGQERRKVTAETSVHLASLHQMLIFIHSVNQIQERKGGKEKEEKVIKVMDIVVVHAVVPEAQDPDPDPTLTKY